ncbi:hypothetical protein JFA41_003884 [Salmonella enterica subsp. enterica serovar Poona]|nr:hypothetical protein [Salmonella enterica]EHK1092725.1 hypothetical protein [Salmonella enterica subsp. enterica serovar Poona]EBN1281117.1 hypothetical protein [Salmonella enterica]EBR6994664.1 hypothetical protein [Salmonella enterica]EHH5781198.1 hypothetical protein [Salmonella enterica]
MTNLLGSQQWFTPQECVGVPGFPTGVSNVRNKLEKLAEGLEGVKRRREGSKATEYHISILPEMTKRYFGVSQESTEASLPSSTVKQVNDCKTLWEMIYTAMTQAQREAVVDIFITGGLKMLMPTVIELASVESSTRKEILLQRGDTENSSSAPNVSTQSKKAG